MSRHYLLVTASLAVVLAALVWTSADAQRRPQALHTVGSSAPLPAGATATRLADGRVMLMGGYGRSGAVGAWMFDPSTKRMVAVPMPMTVARVGHSATLLPDGSVLIVRGRCCR